MHQPAPAYWDTMEPTLTTHPAPAAPEAIHGRIAPFGIKSEEILLLASAWAHIDVATSALSRAHSALSQLDGDALPAQSLKQTMKQIRLLARRTMELTDKKSTSSADAGSEGVSSFPAESTNVEMPSPDAPAPKKKAKKRKKKGKGKGKETVEAISDAELRALSADGGGVSEDTKTQWEKLMANTKGSELDELMRTVAENEPREAVEKAMEEVKMETASKE